MAASSDVLSSNPGSKCFRCIPSSLVTRYYTFSTLSRCLFHSWNLLLSLTTSSASSTSSTISTLIEHCKFSVNDGFYAALTTLEAAPTFLLRYPSSLLSPLSRTNPQRNEEQNLAFSHMSFCIEETAMFYF